MDINELNQLKMALRSGKATIDFTKVNGNRRTMVATLDAGSGMPAIESSNAKVKDTNLLVVWDTEHAGWRTIKVDSIRSWTAGEVEGATAQPSSPPTIGGWQPNTPVPSKA
jgi:hypothetical protein